MSTKLTEEIAECEAEIEECYKTIRTRTGYINYEQEQIKVLDNCISALRKEITKWQARIHAGETDKRMSDVMELPKL